MESNNGTQTADVIELIGGQLDVMVAMLTRPVVLWQLLVLFLILLVSWLLPEGFRRYRGRRGLPDDLVDAPNVSQRRSWLAVVARLATPIVALALLYIAIALFASRGYPNGLLQHLTIVIWLWLFYRVVQGLLNSRFGESAGPYQNRIVTPLFLLLVTWQVFSTVPGASGILSATVDLGLLSVSIGGFVTAFVVFYLFALAAWIVQKTMVRALPVRLHAEPGVIESVAALTRYSLLAVGIIVSLGLLGLDFTSLAIVAGGLSVGIGIGLQDIVANFVSGLVLLFEQSLRPGDVIELGSRISRVEKISLRATTVRTRTNAELIIPNASFTTGEVKNLTKSDPLAKLSVPFGVSYGCDPEQVRQLTIETALQHPLTLAYPPPNVMIRGYGDSSLDFDLLININRPELTASIRSDLYYALWKVFAEHNIEIPFPQMDVNLRAGWEQIASNLPSN